MADALAIVGPTAAGKSELAVEVAERLDGEVISADSRQVYRGMDVGTAKPSLELRARVPHHGLDLVDPGERYSAGRFGRDARGWIAAIRARGRVPVIAGGTGFFVRALTHPLFREPDLPAAPRARLRAWLDARREAELRRWLAALDPDHAAELAARKGGGGRQRLARALEVALLSGRPLSWWHGHAPEEAAPLDLLVFVLAPPRAELDRRIDARVATMVKAGLVEEVASLLAAGYGPRDPGMSATGYPETARHLRGEIQLENAMDEIRRATRRYARRQLTWFRHQLPPGAAWLDGSRPTTMLADEIAGRWNALEET